MAIQDFWPVKSVRPTTSLTGLFDAAGWTGLSRPMLPPPRADKNTACAALLMSFSSRLHCHWSRPAIVLRLQHPMWLTVTRSSHRKLVLRHPAAQQSAHAWLMLPRPRLVSISRPDAMPEPPESIECVVCWDVAADVVLQPCSHACSCTACAENVMSKAALCPTCWYQINCSISVQS